MDANSRIVVSTVVVVVGVVVDSAGSRRRHDSFIAFDLDHTFEPPEDACFILPVSSAYAQRTDPQLFFFLLVKLFLLCLHTLVL